MQDAKNAFRAGLVLVAGLAIALFFFASSKKSTLDARNSRSYFAYLTDASGVNAKSLITVAGLQVGEIEKIELVAVTMGEFVVDYDARAPLVLARREGGPRAAGVGLGSVEHNEEFDHVLAHLFEQLGAKSTAETSRLKNETLRVAKVSMRISNEVRLPVDTWVRKESLGVLGAKALFLELGRETTAIEDGGRIHLVRSMTGTDALLSQAEGIVADVRSITGKLDGDIGGITADIKGITGALNRFVTGDGKSPPLDELYQMVMTDLRRLTQTINGVLQDARRLVGKNDDELTKIVANVQRITHDIAELTAGGTGSRTTAVLDDGGKPTSDQTGRLVLAGGEGDLRATMRSVRTIADDLTSVTGQLKTMLGDNKDQVKDGVSKLQVTLGELNRTLSSLSEVAGRVERGEGTVGRLLTDENMANKVENAVNGAADFVSGLTSLEAHVDIGSWYNVNRERTTTTLSLRLQPKPDKFYLVELVDDGGNLERVVETTTSGGVTRSSTREEDNQIRITAMIARRFFDFLVLRAGLIETTGGVGANVYWFHNRLELRSDLFGTRGPRDSLVTDALGGLYLPRWRTVVKGQPLPHLYLSAGVDDVLNAWNFSGGGLRAYDPARGYGLDWFFGVGLTFKDDDLRSLLPFLPGG
jgi:phospholipid/cholesterol/gamma-HCH transport system substrate-binding protein